MARRGSNRYPIETVMRLTVWLLARRTPVDAQGIMQHLGICRASAYRYMRLFEDICPAHAALVLDRKKYKSK